MKKPDANGYGLFISSVQKELAEERRAVKDFIIHDPLLRRFIRDVFLFEDVPAGDRKPDDIYLEEVAQCDVYLAILGNEYGWKNDSGMSATELEFDKATKTRAITRAPRTHAAQSIDRRTVVPGEVRGKSHNRHNGYDRRL